MNQATGEAPRHVVLVRHGESEGDVRRAAWKRGEYFVSTKRPEEEGLTTMGIGQSRQAGSWIAKHILVRYSLECFDAYFVSLSLRSLQSAVAMDYKDVTWLGDERLNARNRGYVRGLKAEQHHELFPASYEIMHQDPLHWVPPGGESILDVAERWRSFYEDIRGLRSALIVGHRDQMWAAMQQLEYLSDNELLAVDTDEIHNAHIIHYTSLDPETREQAPVLMWKRSVDPLQNDISSGWHILPRVAERYGRL